MRLGRRKKMNFPNGKFSLLSGARTCRANIVEWMSVFFFQTLSIYPLYNSLKNMPNKILGRKDKKKIP